MGEKKNGEGVARVVVGCLSGDVGRRKRGKSAAIARGPAVRSSVVEAARGRSPFQPSGKMRQEGRERAGDNGKDMGGGLENGMGKRGFRIRGWGLLEGMRGRGMEMASSI